MTHEQIAIVALLALQAVTLFLLWEAVKHGDKWRDMWMRDTSELLYWKRNATLRHPLTGRYIKKAKR